MSSPRSAGSRPHGPYGSCGHGAYAPSNAAPVSQAEPVPASGAMPPAVDAAQSALPDFLAKRLARKLALAWRQWPVTLLHGGAGADRRALLDAALLPLLGRRAFDRPAPGHAARPLPFPSRGSTPVHRRSDACAEVVVLLHDWDTVPIGSAAAAMGWAVRLALTSSDTAARPDVDADADADADGVAVRPERTRILLVLEGFERFLALDPTRPDVAAFRVELSTCFEGDPPGSAMPLATELGSALQLHLLMVVDDAARPEVVALGRTLPAFGRQAIALSSGTDAPAADVAERSVPPVPAPADPPSGEDWMSSIEQVLMRVAAQGRVDTGRLPPSPAAVAAAPVAVPTAAPVAVPKAVPIAAPVLAPAAPSAAEPVAASVARPLAAPAPAPRPTPTPAPAEASAPAVAPTSRPMPAQVPTSLRSWPAWAAAAAVCLVVASAWMWGTQAEEPPTATVAEAPRPAPAAPAPGTPAAPAAPAAVIEGATVVEPAAEPAPVRPQPPAPPAALPDPVQALAKALAPLPLVDLRAGGSVDSLPGAPPPSTLIVMRYDALPAPPRDSRGASLQVVAPLFIEPIQAWVLPGSPLKHLGQLQGRPVGIGSSGSGDAVTVTSAWRTLFGSAPQASRAQSGPAGSDLQALQRGDVEALVRVGRVPPAPGLRVLTLDPTDASSIRALRRYLPVDLPEDASAADGGRTIGVMSFLLSRAPGASGADDLAGRAMQSLCTALPRLRAGHAAAWSGVDPRQPLPAGLPYAASALRAATACSHPVADARPQVVAQTPR